MFYNLFALGEKKVFPSKIHLILIQQLQTNLLVKKNLHSLINSCHRYSPMGDDITIEEE